jgi:photosystem II stability/assembly factor-like uncharacterized protein
MTDLLRRYLRWPTIFLIGGIAIASFAGGADPATQPSAQHSAAPVVHAEQVPLLAIAQAGKRLVAVGDHGVVLLSDDQGHSFRQARQVPTQALLTSLSFIDAEHGWAAGHDGVIIATVDGGETWTLQHEDLDGDKALFAIHFADLEHGMAVGLFGTALRTEDGGRSWAPFELDSQGGDDKHLYAIFGDASSGLFIAAESGTLYRSVDNGVSWTRLDGLTTGSLWAGAVLADGSLLAAGQRGHLIRSEDHGASWTEIASYTQQSLTGIVQSSDGTVWLCGLAGTVARSDDGGRDYIVLARPARVPLTGGVAVAEHSPLWIGQSGVVFDRPSP